MILLNGTSIDALIDSGAMVSTISESAAKSISSAILPLEDFGLSLSVADGSKLDYLGYIECELQVHQTSPVFRVPILVIADSKFCNTIPVIIGTNVIRLFRDADFNDEMSDQWQTAFDSLQCATFPAKFSGRNKTVLKPFQTLTVNCVARNVPHDIAQVVTENRPDGNPGFLVCPRVVNLKQSGSYAKFAVSICNITAKPISFSSRSKICQLSEVQVVDDLTSSLSTSVPKAPSTSSDLGVKINKENLTPDQLLRVQQVLGKWTHIFSTGPMDIGHTTLLKHKIVLEDPKPFKQPYRRIPPGMYEEVRQHIKDMLQAGVIRESESPWSSNVVLVRKKDGSLRFCIDWRLLNSKTRKDAYMLPRFDDIADSLVGSTMYSKLDLRSGYWNVEVEEEDKPKTAFSVGNLGFYEWNRLGFGLCNAPAQFQRLVERCMGDLHLRDCLVFIDDILIFSKTFEEHVERLEAVFGKLAEHGLKLKPSKCELFMDSVTYLGHVVSKQGIHTDPEKVSAIKSWPVPKNVKEMRQFLSFAGYYRRFIRNYASIVEPLNALLKGHCTQKSKSKSKSKKRPTVWNWSDTEQKAFDTIIEKLTSAPVLAYADYSLPFVLHTDSSGAGLGAVLYQNQEGQDRVIAYASRGLKPSEKKYPAHKLEFLALKWAVTEKFHDYLCGSTFTVVTDNNPLTYVLTSAKLDATGHRWVAALANYNFTLSYRPGKLNADADGLSRRPLVFPDDIKAICHAVTADVPLADTVATPHLPPSAGEAMTLQQDLDVNWGFEHGKDRAIARVISLLRSGSRPRGRNLAKESPAVQKLLRQWKYLEVQDGTLYRTTMQNGEPVRQLVLPESFRSTALKGVHDDVGHPGKEKTLWLARQRFYWPGLEKDVNLRVEHCGRCIRRKSRLETAEMVSVSTSRPMELVCMDFLSLEKSKGGFEHILVITDHFTRYAQAVPCRNQTAQTTAKALYENFIKFYSFPERLHSDQGRNFESKVIKELCKIAGTAKTRTTPYHPMGNGSCERFNQSLLKMLGTLEVDQKTNWNSYVGPLVQAYNATQSSSTGFSPHYLMFGWHPKLAVDILLGTGPKDSSTDKASYVQKLHQRIQYAYQKAAEEASRSADKSKTLYDRKVSAAKLEVGDRVLVRSVGHQGKHKLADRWEETPYRILRIPNPDLPVFEVQREDGQGPLRKLHRNMLLQFNVLPPDPVQFGQDQHSNADRQPAKQKSASRPRSPSPDSSSDTSSSNSESSVPRYRIPQRRQQKPRPRRPPDKSEVIILNEPTTESFGATRMFRTGERTVTSSRAGDSAVSGPTPRSLPATPQAPTPRAPIPQAPTPQAAAPQAPTPSPEPTRPVRSRRAPDRYGQWVTPVQAEESQIEYFV